MFTLAGALPLSAEYRLQMQQFRDRDRRHDPDAFRDEGTVGLLKWAGVVLDGDRTAEQYVAYRTVVDKPFVVVVRLNQLQVRLPAEDNDNFIQFSHHWQEAADRVHQEASEETYRRLLEEHVVAPQQGLLQRIGSTVMNAFRKQSRYEAILTTIWSAHDEGIAPSTNDEEAMSPLERLVLEKHVLPHQDLLGRIGSTVMNAFLTHSRYEEILTTIWSAHVGGIMPSTNDEEAMPPLEDLPDSIHLKVLSFVPLETAITIMGTNRRFRSLLLSHAGLNLLQELCGDDASLENFSPKQHKEYREYLKSYSQVSRAVIRNFETDFAGNRNEALQMLRRFIVRENWRSIVCQKRGW